MSQPGYPGYYIAGALDTLFPGIVVQANLAQAAYTYWVSVSYRPLVSGDVAAILAAANVLNENAVEADYVPTTEPNYPTSLPTYPTGLPRFPDANGGMTTPDGWNITYDGQVVQG